jgi:hypothetical protein
MIYAVCMEFSEKISPVHGKSMSITLDWRPMSSKKYVPDVHTKCLKIPHLMHTTFGWIASRFTKTNKVILSRLLYTNRVVPCTSLFFSGLIFKEIREFYAWSSKQLYLQVMAILQNQNVMHLTLHNENSCNGRGVQR